VKMLMKIGPPMMRGSLVMSMASISPSRRDVSSAESLRRRAKVLLPRFRLETATLHPETFLLIFFLGQNPSYRRRWALGACPRRHKLERRAVGGRARPQACRCLVGPLILFLSLIFFLYFKTILRKFSGHLELLRISTSSVAFSGPEFQLRQSPSSCETCKIREKRHKNCIIK
jgi:hypothetical protein